MYKIQLTKQAEKAFGTLMRSQPQMGARMAQALDRLSRNPKLGIPLRGELKACWKYRVGPYRIIYEIAHARLLIIVIDIGHRKEVYR